MVETKVLVGVAELARILGVKRSWVYQRVRLGKNILPFVKVGRYLRFNLEEVLEYLKETTT